MNRQHLAWALSTLALVPGSDIASAQMRTQSFQRETQFAYRIPDRFLALDLNHDGNISRDEMNRAENARFASATHGKNTMTPEQFGFLYTQQFRERTDALFRKLDWNGDGNLSLEEYASPKRARFEAFEDDRGEETVRECACLSSVVCVECAIARIRARAISATKTISITTAK